MYGRLLGLLLAAGITLSLAQTQLNPPESGQLPLAAPATAPKPQLSAEMRGDIFMARKMYREAIDTFRESSQKDPVILNKTGIAYHQLMQLKEARKRYEQALKLKPDYVEAMNNIGTTYYAQKNWRRAISWYNRALKIAPNETRSASIYMNLGTAQFARKRYNDAVKSYQIALSLDPEIFERHGNFGVILQERTVQERAKYNFFIAKLYAQNGRNELAIQYLRKALEGGFKEKKLSELPEVPEFAGLRELPEFKELLAREPRVL
jgi:tetratricopeptide (TPR) repeat protein